MKTAWLLLLITAIAAWAEPPPVVRDAQAPAVRALVDLASIDVLRVRERGVPRLWKKPSAIFSATSTAVEPLSE